MDRSEKVQILRNTLAGFDIELTDRMCDQFLCYYDLLTEKNKVMNLTAITDYEEVVVRHFLDSLALLPSLPLSDKALSVMDLGTGAGFPGIPLKIVCPSLQMVLADSLQKRVGFLNEVIRECALEGISAIHGRAEDLGRDPELRDQFDLCVSRAVARLSVLSEYCMPFVRKGGMFISYKGENSEAEIKSAEKSIEVLGGEIADIQKIHLPGTDAERVFVLIKKIRNTPGKYPRKAGTPAKEPIK